MIKSTCLRGSFLILFSVIIYIAAVFLKDTLVTEAICRLAYLKNKMGEFYIDRLDFKLASDEEQIFDAENYVLKDNKGNKWLFKVENDKEIVKVLVVYTLANVLGVKTPDTYRADFAVNGNKKPVFL